MPPILINRTPIHDDDHSGTTGTSLDNAWKQEFYDQIDQALSGIYNSSGGTAKDAAQDIQITNNTNAIAAATANKLGATIIATTDTGTKNDFALPGRTKDTVWLWSGNADLILSGIANGATGDRLTIKNQSNNSSKILCQYNGVGSVAANRLYNVVTSAPTPVGYGGWITYVWNGGWTPIDHEQGAAIAYPYSAANFLNGSGGSWTVGAGDIGQLTSVVRGKTLTIFVTIGSGALPSAAAYLLMLAPAYGGFIGAGPQTLGGAVGASGASGIEGGGFVQIASTFGMDRIAIYRPATAVWAAGSSVATYFTFTFPIA